MMDEKRLAEIGALAELAADGRLKDRHRFSLHARQAIVDLLAEVRRLRRLEAALPHISDGTDPAKLGWWCGTDEQWQALRASIVRNGDKPVGLTADVLRAALEAE